MTEDEMLREIVQDDSPKQMYPYPYGFERATNKQQQEWNVQMYYEAMGYDFEQDDEE